MENGPMLNPELSACDLHTLHFSVMDPFLPVIICCCHWLPWSLVLPVNPRVLPCLYCLTLWASVPSLAESRAEESHPFWFITVLHAWCLSVFFFSIMIVSEFHFDYAISFLNAFKIYIAWMKSQSFLIMVISMRVLFWDRGFPWHWW